jgi:hypothetical protein
MGSVQEAFVDQILGTHFPPALGPRLLAFPDLQAVEKIKCNAALQF